MSDSAVNDPLGWTEEWDETYQCFFFFHAASGESSWERPPGLPESEDAKQVANMSEVHDSQLITEITPEVVEEAANWTVAWDDNYNCEFFYNTVTCETLWEKPACLVALQAPPVEVKVDEIASKDPANWSIEWDATYGCNFYVNTVTQESSWELPACLEDNKKDTEDVDIDVGEVEDKFEKVVNVSSSNALKIPPKRRNSVMRRPSAKPDQHIVKKAAESASIIIMSAHPSTYMSKNPTKESTSDTTAQVVTDSVPDAVTTTDSSESGPLVDTSDDSQKPKRRQSLAPRPAALPPKPLFIPVGNEGVILEGDEDEDDDETGGRGGDLRGQKLLPSEGINVIMQSTRHLQVEGDIEVMKKKPRAIGTYLMKKSPALMKGWQKRYVVMQEGMIKYYGSVSSN